MQLDEVHRRHGEARAVHHARDVAIQRDVVEVVLARTALHRVLLRGVALFCEIRLPEERIRVDVDLRIERQELALPGDDERIHLDEARILLEVQPVQRHQDRLELAHLLRGEAEPEGELAALVRLQTRRRVHVHGEDLLGRMRRDFLDVHATRRGCDDAQSARARDSA